MPITLLDGILLGITLVSAVLAMVRGFSREVLSLASWAAAAVAAYLFYPLALPYLQPHISNETIAKIAAAGAVFIVVLIIVSIITMKIADFIIDSRIGALDRTLGFLFGAARGVLLMVVAMLFFNWLVPENQPEWVANAKSKPLLDQLGAEVVSFLPADPEAQMEKLKQKIQPSAPGTQPQEQQEPQEEAPVPDDTPAQN